MSAIDYRHVSILWAAPEHADELAALHALLFDKPWDAAAFRGLLNHPGSTAFLARVGNVPDAVGFIIGQLAADEAEILSLGVTKAHQRHGIGQRLAEALGRAAKKAEARRLHLEVAESNAAALGLYRKMGFAETGRRKGYYAAAGKAPEDALTLARNL
jgi:ribosomal-protein-alanine N-acetyltransferase